MRPPPPCFIFFFFNDTATTEIYTLSLHDALPISLFDSLTVGENLAFPLRETTKLSETEIQKKVHTFLDYVGLRSEEHTSELQSPDHLVCRLLLEKKKKNTRKHRHDIVHNQMSRRL